MPVTDPNVVYYSITYDGDGGNNLPYNAVKEHGRALIVSSVVPSKSERVMLEGSAHDQPFIIRDYEFVGWKASTDNKIYQPGSSYEVDADTTMVAQWIPKTNSPIVTIEYFYRTISIDSDVPSDNGTAARCILKIKIDRTFYVDNELKDLDNVLYIDDEISNNQINKHAISTNSTVKYIEYEYVETFKLPNDSVAKLSIRASDTKTDKIGEGTASIGTSIVPLEFAYGGQSVGILKNAGPKDSISLGSLILSDVHKPHEFTYRLSDLINLLSFYHSTTQWINIYTNGGQGIWYKYWMGVVYLKFILNPWTGVWQVPTNLDKHYCPSVSCYFSIGRTTNNTASVWVGTDGGIYFYCFDTTNPVIGIVSWPID